MRSDSVVRAVPHSRRRPALNDDVLHSHARMYRANTRTTVLRQGQALSGQPGRPAAEMPVVGLQQEMAGCQHQSQRWFHDLRHRQRAQYREVQAVRDQRVE